VVKSSGIRSVSEQVKNCYIIYDARLAGQISTQWFEPDYWRGTGGEVQTVGAGRGRAWFVQSQDQHYVLRHYCRGGLAAKISADRYVWTGLQRTRAWREYLLLVKLQELGLPAPRPLAARVQRHGAFYQADLLTRRIPESQPLSRVLAQHALDDSQWCSIGKCIRDFHHHDIYHADLNAHNILLNEQGDIYLIDFDKSGVDQDSSWQLRTLQRLQRSLRKLQAQDTQIHFSEANWQALLAGYRD
jgi:3-deoxy-D-manno-octulosonic acid kinase